MNINDDKHRYEHLLHLPHHRSKKRKAMSMIERAAQFGAFRALTGYEAAISETSRLTDEKIEIDEYQKMDIDFKIRYIGEHIFEMPEISVTYFIADSKKSGGKYVEHTGIIEKILYYHKKIKFTDGTEIYVEDILSIDSEIFNQGEF